MSKSIRCLALIAFLFASLVTYARFPAEAQSDTDTLASIVVHLLVTTSNGSQEGSGVIVSPDGIIFTAAHVVEDASEIRVELFDGFETSPIFAYYARVQYISTLDNFDFAILEIFANDQGIIDPTTLNLPYIQSWSRVAVFREPIQIFGYLQSAAGVLHVTDGIIGSTPGQPIPIGGTTQNRFVFYQTNAIMGMGDSGGLVINSENEFIGIPIDWEDDEGGYVATILPIGTICEIEPDVCEYEPDQITILSTPNAGISTNSSYSGYCYGDGWEYDDQMRTMTWTCATDGREDVWQPQGQALNNVRAGYTVIFGPMDVPGQIFACQLMLNGQVLKNSCDAVLVDVPAGTEFKVQSAGTVGGFRWCPSVGYGYRRDNPDIPCR